MTDETRRDREINIDGLGLIILMWSITGCLVALKFFGVI
jgi:hypothetical protein